MRDDCSSDVVQGPALGDAAKATLPLRSGGGSRHISCAGVKPDHPQLIFRLVAQE
jgi:hypothetical protein